MSASPRADYLASALDAVLAQTPTGDGTAKVKLDDGGVLIIAKDGDHVLINVVPVHFEPGVAVPF